MSFKDKAREIREQGAAERANYSPATGSVPLRMYSFWASVRPDKVPTRENFCHYWRVVAIWAPLWFLATKYQDFFESKTGKIVSIAVIIAAVLMLASLGSGGFSALGWLLLGAYVFVGFIVGAVYENVRHDFKQGALMEPGSGKIFAAFTLPAVLGYSVARLVRFLGDPKRTKVLSKIGLALMALCGAALVGLIVYGFIVNTVLALQILGILVGIVVAGAGLAFGLAFLSDFLKHRHAASVAKRTTYVEQERYGYVDTVAVVEPSRVAKFFMAIGDFLNLAFQVVRVKKWKICPIVEIPQ